MKLRDIFHDTFTIEFHLLGFWFGLGIWQERCFRTPFHLHLISPFGNVISFDWTIYQDRNSVTFRFFKCKCQSDRKESEKIYKEIRKRFEKEEQEIKIVKQELKDNKLEHIIQYIP